MFLVFPTHLEFSYKFVCLCKIQSRINRTIAGLQGRNQMWNICRDLWAAQGWKFNQTPTFIASGWYGERASRYGNSGSEIQISGLYIRLHYKPILQSYIKIQGNIRKIFFLTAKKDVKTWRIIAVMYTTWASLKIEPKTKLALKGFEPMTSAIPMQCSTNWGIKPSGNWSSWNS